MGSQTNIVPTIGIREQTAGVKPMSNADGTRRVAKAAPVNVLGQWEVGNSIGANYRPLGKYGPLLCRKRKMIDDRLFSANVYGR